jgi:hypothetical protein
LRMSSVLYRPMTDSARGIVVRIAARPDRADRAGVGEAFGVANGQALELKGLVHHSDRGVMATWRRLTQRPVGGIGPSGVMRGPVWVPVKTISVAARSSVAIWVMRANSALGNTFQSACTDSLTWSRPRTVTPPGPDSSTFGAGLLRNLFMSLALKAVMLRSTTLLRSCHFSYPLY